MGSQDFDFLIIHGSKYLCKPHYIGGIALQIIGFINLSLDMVYLNVD